MYKDLMTKLKDQELLPAREFWNSLLTHERQYCLSVIADELLEAMSEAGDFNEANRRMLDGLDLPREWREEPLYAVLMIPLLARLQLGYNRE